MPRIDRSIGSLRWLIALNSGLVLAALLAGWIASTVADAPAYLSSSGIAKQVAAPWGENFRTILAGNATVVGIMLLGLCTLGAVSLVTLCWNGFLLGFGLSSLFRAHTAVVLWLLLYVPLEFAALALAAAASEALSIAVVSYLLHDTRPRLRPVWSVLAAAMALLVLGAAIEAHVIVRVNDAVRLPDLELSDGDEWIGAETAHEDLPRLSTGTLVLPAAARAFVRPGRSQRSRQDDAAQRDRPAVEGERRGGVV